MVSGVGVPSYYLKLSWNEVGQKIFKFSLKFVQISVSNFHNNGKQGGTIRICAFYLENMEYSKTFLIKLLWTNTQNLHSLFQTPGRSF